ncbi:MAG TPA: hypothetical protein VIL84_05405 [Devosiaceae bacterium]
MSEGKKAKVPEHVAVYLDALGLIGPDRVAEEDAYYDIISLINEAPSVLAKKTYEEALSFTIEGEAMRLTYCRDQVLKRALEDEKEARRHIQPIEQFEALEHLLAQATYTDGFGKSRRYPLRTSGGHYVRSAEIARTARLSEAFLPQAMVNSYYQFGVHSFWVGKAIEGIFRLFEERYGLDLVDLERKRFAERRASKK